MSIGEKDVRHIARLARLELTDEQVRATQDQLGKILLSMEELRQLDTSGVAPTSSVLGLSDVTRPDEAVAFPERESLLSLSPEREGPYFKVRKVIE